MSYGSYATKNDNLNTFLETELEQDINPTKMSQNYNPQGYNVEGGNPTPIELTKVQKSFRQAENYFDTAVDGVKKFANDERVVAAQNIAKDGLTKYVSMLNYIEKQPQILGIITSIGLISAIFSMLIDFVLGFSISKYMANVSGIIVSLIALFAELPFLNIFSSTSYGIVFQKLYLEYMKILTLSVGKTMIIYLILTLSVVEGVHNQGLTDIICVVVPLVTSLLVNCLLSVSVFARLWKLRRTFTKSGNFIDMLNQVRTLQGLLDRFRLECLNEGNKNITPKEAIHILNNVGLYTPECSLNDLKALVHSSGKEPPEFYMQWYMTDVGLDAIIDNQCTPSDIEAQISTSSSPRASSHPQRINSFIKSKHSPPPPPPTTQINKPVASDSPVSVINDDTNDIADVINMIDEHFNISNFVQSVTQDANFLQAKNIDEIKNLKQESMD